MSFMKIVLAWVLGKDSSQRILTAVSRDYLLNDRLLAVYHIDTGRQVGC